MYFKDTIVTVFGGTGSIGSAIVEYILPYEPLQIRVFSNNEMEIFEMRKRLNHKDIEYILGDIKDFNVVNDALKDAWFCFNCAALKHVDLCEQNVIESVKTNILGLDNILNACSLNHVQKIVHVSTDKAVEPSSVMGATKLIGERLCLSYKNLNVAIVRFGNVYGSRGSLVPIINRCLDNGKEILLTDIRMKRYFIQLKDAASIICEAMKNMNGGEIFIPKMQEHKVIDIIYDLITKRGFKLNEVNIREVGARKGEKLTEKLMTESEAENAKELKGVYMIK